MLGSQSNELDHLIPLGLGGDPTPRDNLWLQIWPEAAIKDRDERAAASGGLCGAEDVAAGAAGDGVPGSESEALPEVEPKTHATQGPYRLSMKSPA